MNEIFKRFLTSIFCIVYSLILKSYNIYTVSLYYFILTIICLFEYHYKINSTRKKITILLSAIIYCILIHSVLNGINKNYITIILPITMSLFSIELFYGEMNPMLSIGTDLIGIVWICVPMVLCTLLCYPYDESLGYRIHDPRLMYSIMLLVFFNDTGAYFFGKYFGKHKLYSAISPKKTWEGSIGGGITSTCVYFIVKDQYTFLSYKSWFVILIISVICGSIGDLIESMFKRDLQIKDTGTILPGMGGCLDRLDSLLYSIPIIYFYLVATGNFI